VNNSLISGFSVSESPNGLMPSNTFAVKWSTFRRWACGRVARDLGQKGSFDAGAYLHFEYTFIQQFCIGRADARLPSGPFQEPHRA
jgi:hypothetical protein